MPLAVTDNLCTALRCIILNRARYLSVLYPHKNREEWSKEECARLKELIAQLGEGNWVEIAKAVRISVCIYVEQTDERDERERAAAVTELVCRICVCSWLYMSIYPPLPSYIYSIQLGTRNRAQVKSQFDTWVRRENPIKVSQSLYINAL